LHLGQRHAISAGCGCDLDLKTEASGKPFDTLVLSLGLSSLDIFGQVFWESLEDVVVGYYEDP